MNSINWQGAQVLTSKPLSARLAMSTAARGARQERDDAGVVLGDDGGVHDAAGVCDGPVVTMSRAVRWW
jgi:hypothetical protein